MTQPIGETLQAPRPHVSRATAVIYSIFYWPYLIGTCAILFWPALILFLLTFFWDKNLNIVHRYTSYWAGHYLTRAPLVETTIRGREKLGKGPYVFISNHQSMVDVLAVFATHLDFKWVSKIENFYAPFIGWGMIVNRYVAVKRGHLPSILRMYRRSIAWLKRGASLWVFPEGTRTSDGNLQKFHRGAFGLSVRCKAPIVPVVVVGTGEILPKGSVLITPTPVTIHVLDPISPEEADNDWDKLSDLARRRMAEELEKIRAARP